MKGFLASSFADVADLFADFTNGECRGKTITFIPTASINEKVNFYVEAAKAAFQRLGVAIDELEISTAAPELISRKLETNDYIYVSGGNSFFLLQELTRSGAAKIIEEQVKLGKIYVGESAGAVVIAPDIEYTAPMDTPSAAPDLHSFASLGLVDFYPLPHYKNEPFKEVAEEIMSRHEGRIALFPFSNEEAIIVEGREGTILRKPA